jgi:hypothetical protein
MKILKELSLVPTRETEGLPGVLREFYKWENSLRNDLARLRSAASERDPKEDIRPGDVCPETSGAASAAYNESSPLKAEMNLNRFRWDKISALCSAQYFNFDVLVCYALHLRILERQAEFREETGMENYRTLYSSILNQVDSETSFILE